jgi:hypothetical protein
MPHEPEELLPGQHLPLVTQEHGKQPDLTSRQGDLASVERGAVRGEIQAQRSRAQDAAVLTAPSQARPDPRDQLLDGERLRDVVVGPRLEPGHL